MEGGRPVPVAGSERVLEADLVFLAMGFLGPEATLAQVGTMWVGEGGALAQVWAWRSVDVPRGAYGPRGKGGPKRSLAVGGITAFIG